MTGLPQYHLERNFEASIENVWKCWSEADLLSVWYGPGVETVIHELTLESGGQWMCEMRFGEQSHFQLTTFSEVDAPNRWSGFQSSCDSEGKIINNPMMPDWPRSLQTEVTLETIENGTRLTLTWTPHEASEAQIACFASMMGGAGKGWEKGMDEMARLLSEI